MKKTNCKTNKPLMLGVTANCIQCILNQLEFANTAAGNMCRGALCGFAIVMIGIGLWDMKHGTTVCQLKKNFIARLRGQ